jgi:hypothetical protein
MTMNEHEAMQAVLKQVLWEAEELLALVEAVSKPGEKLTVADAIRRYWENGDTDTAAEICTLCAYTDRGVNHASLEAVLAATERILDQALAAT